MISDAMAWFVQTMSMASWQCHLAVVMVRAVTAFMTDLAPS